MTSIQPLAYNAHEPQYQQALDWSCSACSLAWLNRALGIQHATTETDAIAYIGEPENINSLYGLMDASGSRLVQCLREQGAPAFSGWPTFDQACKLASAMPLLLGGVGWYHWVGVRTTQDGLLILANSAEGWMNIYDSLGWQDWDQLGPFACVAVPLLHSFPPPPTT